MDSGFGLGKLPASFLASLLGRYVAPDPRLLVRPGVGLDAAVIDLGETLLVVKSDPITFATDEIGWYAVHVNANDVACMGATPQWFFATILLPDGSTPALVERVFEGIRGACESLGVTLAGGHTEITHRIDRPIVAGTMLGTTTRERMVTPERAQAGDLLVVAKGFPIEGTALIARERAEELRARGWTEEELAEAQRFLHEPGISVVQAARVAADAVPLNGMHDPTEGGLATGLREIAHAAGLGFEVWAEQLPLLPLGARVCNEFGLDPLGMIASGALCIAVAPEHEAALLEAFAAAGIPAVGAGRLLGAGQGEWLVKAGQRVPFPEFAVDEITKLF